MRVGIVDYRMGNLASVAKAVEHVGGEAFVSANPRELRRADVVILPGVGNFAAGMDNLESEGLSEFVKEWASERPTVGICLGMQLLFESSEEGDRKGLGVLEGNVVRIKGDVKIPHMGWNEMVVPAGSPFAEFSGHRFYFVHSYVCEPSNGIAVGSTSYGGDFVSLVASRNIVGMQFHPEKSSDDGLRLLEATFRSLI